MSKRAEIRKTYKLYINGQFPRSESGRFIELENSINVCRASRKDFRNSVTAARDAFAGWSSKTAYNRGQILYRISEMLEGRKAQFIDELLKQGLTQKEATLEVDQTIDLFVQYAGWADKFQQVFSSVNPVQSKHFDFSAPTPMGVVGVICPDANPLLGLAASLAPVIVGGNTAVVIASETSPLSALTLAEVINSSDVPAGVVNILSGLRSELLEHFSTHMDVNAVVYNGKSKPEINTIKENSILNLKRVFSRNDVKSTADPYWIMDCQEVKTTWHPIGI